MSAQMISKGSTDLDRATARALVEAGYMPIERYRALFELSEPTTPTEVAHPDVLCVEQSRCSAQTASQPAYAEAGIQQTSRRFRTRSQTVSLG